MPTKVSFGEGIQGDVRGVVQNPQYYDNCVRIQSNFTIQVFRRFKKYNNADLIPEDLKLNFFIHFRALKNPTLIKMLFIGAKLFRP